MSLLYGRLAARAAARADAVAIVAGPRSLTYRELIALADARADELRSKGIGEGMFVGWLGHNSPEMIAALLGCTKAGAVFVPLNWRLAVPELAAIGRHAGLAVLLGTPELASLADAVRQAIAAEPPLPAEPAQPGDAMLVYTSGTTGDPKGALHTQAGMLANLSAALATQPIDASTRVLSVLPLFHVGGLCIQTLPALAAGAVVNLHPRFDPAAWLRDVREWRPHTSLLVPAVMKALVEHPDWPAADLESLAFVNSGSQVVPLALIEAFHARGVPVAQVYGSTESGPVSIALPPGRAISHAGRVGWPAPGVQLRLGDGGEIQLKAANLMRGYHRQAVHPSFADGWLATGDLAVRHADDSIEVVGRSKDLIISGGENIHPAEIENLAVSLPGIAEAAVVGVPDARWGEVPVLALVAQPGVEPDLDALRALFDTRLARFKHPRRIVVVDALPKTALGKVQKARLVDVL